MTTYDIAFPDSYDVADAVLVPPIPGADGKWYFSVYAKKNKDSPALTYLCRWGPGMTEVEFVDLERYTTARGAPAVGPGGARLWLFGFDQGKRLIVQLCPDWSPPAWMNGSAAIAALNQRITELEQDVAGLWTVLGGAGAGLTEEQAADLAWVGKLRRALREA